MLLLLMEHHLPLFQRQLVLFPLFPTVLMLEFLDQLLVLPESVLVVKMVEKIQHPVELKSVPVVVMHLAVLPVVQVLLDSVVLL